MIKDCEILENKHQTSFDILHKAFVDLIISSDIDWQRFSWYAELHAYRKWDWKIKSYRNFSEIAS